VQEAADVEQDAPASGGDRWSAEVGRLVRRLVRRPRLASAPTARAVSLGVLGVVVLSAGMSLYLAVRQPPYRTDESSQVGYVLSLRSGTLPSLDTLVPASAGGEMLEFAVGRPWPFSVPNIHTAINPPFVYAASIVPATLTDAAGVRAGPLLGVRLVNVLGTGLAVYLVYRMARELAADRVVGLLAAALVGTLASQVQAGAFAYLEGPALAATTGVAWWLARFVRSRTTLNATGLGLWCAAAAGVRTMSFAYAAAAGAIALGVAVATIHRDRWLPFALRIGVPTVVLVGWFYAVNVARYGEPTGSGEVYESIGEGPSFLSVLFGVDSYAAPIDYMIFEIPGTRGWWEVPATRQWLVAALSVVVVASAMLLLRNRARTGADAADGAGIGRAPHLGSWWALLGASVLPPIVLSAHVANGGAGHPRYLAPLVPVLATAVAVVVARAGRAVSLVVVVATVGLLCHRVSILGPQHDDSLFPALRGPILDRPLRFAVLAVALAGGVLLIGAHLWLALPSGRRPGRASSDAPDAPTIPVGA